MMQCGLRYDTNVRFVVDTLRPTLELLRGDFSRYYRSRYGGDGGAWRESFHMVFSMSGGAPARVAAITAVREWETGLTCPRQDGFSSFDVVDFDRSS